MTDLGSTLSILAETSMLRRVLSEADLAYMFRHSLDHQTAYHSLLRRDREEIHKVVGLVIEREPSVDLASLAEVLAEHFSEGGDDQRALKYFVMAGNEAARVYAHTEALDHYEAALDLATNLDAASDILRDLYLRRGRTLELSGDYQGALENYRRLEALAESRQDVGLELAALTRQTTLLVAPSSVADSKAGKAMANKLLELAASVGDREAEARGHWSLLLASVYSGDLEQGIAEGEKALALARDLGLEELEAYILNDLSGPHMLSGGPGQAQTMLDQAISIWRRIDNLPMLVDSLGNLNSIFIFSGEYDKALESSRLASEIADRIGNLWAKAFSLFLIELVFAERGDLEQAISVCDDQIRWGKQAGFKIPEVYSNGFKAWIYAYLGAVDRAEPCLEAAFQASPQLGEMWEVLPRCVRVLVNLKQGVIDASDTAFLDRTVEEGLHQGLVNSPVGPFWWLADAESALARGHFDKGIERLQRVVERQKASGFSVQLCDTFELLARLQRATGDSQAAFDALDQAEAAAEHLTSRRMLWVIRAERALWMEEDGDVQAAAQERRRAVPEFTYIVDHLNDATLRTAFLNSAWVQGLNMG